MRKITHFLVILALSSILCAGCGSTPKETKIESPGLASELANAPQWVLQPSVNGILSSVGSAKVGKAGMQFARTESLANGRDELGRMINVKVKNLVGNFTQVTGIGDDQTVDKVSSQTSKQVTNQFLNGSRQKDMWISPSGELYTLVILDTAAVRDAVKESVMTSYQNEKALWQKFQAKKAYEELDKEIEKEFGEYRGQ